MALQNVHDYDIALPPKAAADVVSRSLKVFQNGVLGFDLNPSVDVPSVPITVVENDVVRLELRDTDNAGNVSEPSVYDFTALDNHPPPAPGQLGATFKEERMVDIQEPLPEPEPESEVPPVEPTTPAPETPPDSAPTEPVPPAPETPVQPVE